MKAITKFVSIDGAEFNTTGEAEARDALVLRCQNIEDMLGSHPGSDERVRHPRLDEYRETVVALCREMFPRERIFTHPAKEIHPFSWAGRFLDECAPKTVNHLWWRLMCVGADGYEYEQPYFASHPEEFRPPAHAQAGDR